MTKAHRPARWSVAQSHLEMEVREDLVNTLYVSTRSMVAGALAGGVVTITIAVKAGVWPLTLAAALISGVGLGRVVLSLAYKSRRRSDPSQASIWEWAYQIGAASFSGLLGIFALLTLRLVQDPTLHLLAATTSIGYAAGIAGRNAARPTVAMTQLSFAALPVALGLLLTPNLCYRILGFVTLMFFASMVDITSQTYGIVLRAFKNAGENQVLAAALQIKAAEAQAANEAKTRFLATMSHEIRTPLNGVLGMTEAMLSDPLTEQQRARLTVVRQSGVALLTLLNDILDLSKVEAGKLEIESAPFDLGELLDSVSATFEAAAAKRGVGLRIVMSDVDMGIYEGDSGRLRQILLNLISNALKFTEAGQIEVKAFVEGGALNLEVSDTGIGIAPEHLDRLFQRFSQADASTTRRFGGTGLGLAICKELTNLLNGSISAQSHLGKGTTFFVTLPITRLTSTPALVHSYGPEPAETEHIAPEPVALVAPTPTLTTNRQARLLCAEDNQVNQMVLRALLEPFNYDLVIVDDGRQALEAYRRETFDLVMLDVQMPIMDGPTAAAAIRLYEAETHRAATPIIALTANVMTDQVRDYLAAGMDQVIAKPLNIDELYAAIKRHLLPSASQSKPALADRTTQAKLALG
jgi:signal transduction histidine kinase/CheY-like chemotaxis protein